ncbi:MAG TPA: DUF5946 family protein [Phototrophicaceae bacterium]|nr:DUF5946 family protein [Phototrophicaceae bacterium]
METPQRCPECGADWTNDATCQDHFHQMLFWENEYPEKTLAVHHLLVLCYHLQHPSLYSPEGLTYARGLLADFVVRGQTPQQVRREKREQVASDKRNFKIIGTPEAHGFYTFPVVWTMTAADVVAGGVEAYDGNIKTWARSIYEVLTAGGH